MIQHGHLHTLLYDVAKEAGVRFLFNTEVTGADPVEGTVTLRGGDVVKADVIVAADGHDSILRPLVTGEEGSVDELPGQRYLSLAFQVPTDALREDGELALLTDPLVVRARLRLTVPSTKSEFFFRSGICG
jgi:salicylate hydroxylase